MIEAVRALAARGEAAFARDVVFLVNGAEENHQLGAHAFATQHEWARNVEFVLNLESMGAGDRELVFQCGAEDAARVLAPLAGARTRAAASPRTRAAPKFFEGRAQGDTDGMVNLGAACLVGRGVPQDEARARELVSRAADAGDDDARRLLNAMDGRRRSDDDPKAMAEPAPTPKATLEAAAAPAPAVDEPAWRRRWGAGLKAGDGVDARDSEGRWFDSVVVDVDGSRVKVHFRGWSTRWDSWFDRDDEGFWANVEPRFALTEDWRRQLRVGDGVETRSEDKPLWYAGAADERTSWVAVKTESPGSPSWIETSSERLCQPGTHIKRHRKASSLATKISALKADASTATRPR
ncbi:hypothetical protein JL720_7228 [Aureococcus anophagefferens]|nr:hypothetical protein JL720_7228 [Aureococcus anophagefferens]